MQFGKVAAEEDSKSTEWDSSVGERRVPLKGQTIFSVCVVIGIFLSIILAIAALAVAVQSKNHPTLEPEIHETTNNYTNSISWGNHPYSNLAIATYDSLVAPVEALNTIVGLDGLLVLAYHDNSNNNFVIRKCLDIACKTTTSTIVDGANPNQITSIMGRDGFLLFVFYDIVYNPNSTVTTLKAIHCNDLDCKDLTLNTVDNAGDVGRSPIVHIAKDGNPLITYMDKESIKIAHCIDYACSFSVEDSHIVVDGGVSAVNSLIGPDGFLFIAFTYTGNGSVALLRCVDLLCTDTDLFMPLGEAGEGISAGMYEDAFSGNVAVILPSGDIFECVDAPCSLLSHYRIPIDPTFTMTTGTTPGFPVFISKNDTVLKLVACTTPSCSKYTVKKVFDVAPLQLLDIQITTIGARLFPLISYVTLETNSNSTSGNGTLSILYCDNPWCNPWRN